MQYIIKHLDDVHNHKTEMELEAVVIVAVFLIGLVVLPIKKGLKTAASDA